MSFPKPAPSLSVDTKILTDRLAQCSIGDIVAYEELTKLIGRDVCTIARSNLTQAVRRMLRDGIVFGTIRGVGIKRLTDEEIVGVGPQTISKFRRASRRASAKLANVQDFNGLPQAVKTTHHMSLSVLGVLTYLTKPSNVRKLETRIETAQQALPLQRTLEAMGVTAIHVVPERKDE